MLHLNVFRGWIEFKREKIQDGFMILKKKLAKTKESTIHIGLYTLSNVRLRAKKIKLKGTRVDTQKR